MRWPVIFLLAASGAWAQTGASIHLQSPMVESSKVFYSNAKQDILRSAEKVPEDKYAFKPVDTVRSYGQVLAHVADGQYEFCGAAAGKHDEKGLEQTAKTKADIVAALKTAFAYCDAIYAGMTDAKAAEMIPAFGGAKITRLSMLDFNVSHTMEHYGNLVTYMRIQGDRAAQQRIAALTRTSIQSAARLRIIWPVIQPASSEARNETTVAMSRGCPTRPNGVRAPAWF